MKQYMTCLVAVMLLGMLTAVHGQTIAPESGYSCSWPTNGDYAGLNNNDGDYYPTPGTVPSVNVQGLDNIALPANGGTAFADGVLNAGPHTSFGLLNNGTYGNDSSWISDTDADTFFGIAFNRLYEISSVAWGRDNTGGFDSGRVPGNFTVQYTWEENPDETTTAWIDIAVITIANSGVVRGGAFSGALRHEYLVSTATANPITATGIRIVADNTTVAIDELEVYGTAPDTGPPEPGLQDVVGVDLYAPTYTNGGILDATSRTWVQDNNSFDGTSFILDGNLVTLSYGDLVGADAARAHSSVTAADIKLFSEAKYIGSGEGYYDVTLSGLRTRRVYEMVMYASRTPGDRGSTFQIIDGDGGLNQTLTAPGQVGTDAFVEGVNYVKFSDLAPEGAGDSITFRVIAPDAYNHFFNGFEISSTFVPKGTVISIR